MNNSNKGAISRPKAILHPVRARILVALHDRPLTPRQLATVVNDVPLGTIYRQINILLEAGLIEVLRERRVNGTLERQFGLVAARDDFDATEREELTAEDIVGLVSVLTGAVQAAFQKYIQQAQLPLPEGEVSLITKSLYVTKEEYTQFRQQVIELLEKAGREPSPEYERRFIAYFSVPDPSNPGSEFESDTPA